jgi:hypothetical protein
MLVKFNRGQRLIWKVTKANFSVEMIHLNTLSCMGLWDYSNGFFALCSAIPASIRITIDPHYSLGPAPMHYIKIKRV